MLPDSFGPVGAFGPQGEAGTDVPAGGESGGVGRQDAVAPQEGRAERAVAEAHGEAELLDDAAGDGRLVGRRRRGAEGPGLDGGDASGGVGGTCVIFGEVLAVGVAQVRALETPVLVAATLTTRYSVRGDDFSAQPKEVGGADLVAEGALRARGGVEWREEAKADLGR